MRTKNRISWVFDKALSIQQSPDGVARNGKSERLAMEAPGAETDAQKINPNGVLLGRQHPP